MYFFCLHNLNFIFRRKFENISRWFTRETLVCTLLKVRETQIILLIKSRYRFFIFCTCNLYKNISNIFLLYISENLSYFMMRQKKKQQEKLKKLVHTKKHKVSFLSIFFRSDLSKYLHKIHKLLMLIFAKFWNFLISQH